MILALDTSSAIAVALVSDSGEVRARRSAFNPRGHAELLSGLVEEALGEAGVARTDVTRIVVGTGPAPFTGLRVGLMTARTLGHVWGVPVEGVCSLDAIGAAHGGEVTVVADARRKEVYWAAYRDGVRVSGPAVSAPGDVPVAGAVVGRGALLYPDAFPGAVEGDPDPALLVGAADRLRAAGDEMPTEPLYLRRPDVHGVPGA
ncbi:tRNA (adenosine(37)-N6)-threonylcarbamoyltransferase complex dimerization subunit type 1 TsaB [Demequina sp. SYSU T00192]|uniref:tRNA (Adenosine(37)-N6)-threonylcarbamoyltransferase complex dimerization subunit type 1 TsaB n=1 Tax=Demequina litoralis TaxID=3051660 RepID=A0ABT8G7B5_9MICO|nr:tRNA (adenosine(37)-N6)-threonylcarbamoyltransferase complex dimerization subunit type 1 TsaB [Demequina sp. SYSU T00192]MDN4475037.1 tRNA (adenosine(37)-N6)-threonylcarbamoyltransferase complex dimerization subunit type 1 TsaB [Demequina sp. SYSU T00192]